MANSDELICWHGSRFPAYSALIVVFSVATLLAGAAQAAVKMTEGKAFPKSNIQEKPLDTKAPVLLEANEVDYDYEGGIAVASGKVAVTQGEMILLADRLIYDQKNEVVTASGNVSILEPNGNVYFSDHAVLRNNMKTGVIEQFKGRMADSSLFVASRARKIDENKTELFKAVYSPCKIYCAQDGKGSDPIWQIKADTALIDQEAQEIKYHNAQFDVYGVPVLYTPYFSHPTPGADNQSGLLTPSFLRSDNIGYVYSQPVYYVFSQDKDITLTPIYTSLVGPVLAGEYRERFDSGSFTLQGSATQAPNTDNAGTPAAGHQFRGDIGAKGQFRITDNADWGFDVRRATDDTYLRLYGFNSDVLLTSRAYVEDFNFGNSDRSYAVMQGLSFQDLTAQVPEHTVPLVLPLTDVTYQTAPGWYNSRFLLTGDAMVLFRQMGDQSRRLSGTGGWKLPYVSDDGEVIEFNANLRTDVYDVSDLTLPGGRNFSGTTGREVPEASVMWRYPFITQLGERSSVMIEPVVQFAAISNGNNPEKIPNEDSQEPEFTDSNLFSVNRYAGLDRIESGSSVTYGVRGQAQFFTDKYVDVLFGQHYRINDDNEFPFSQDPNSRFSDYVGRIGLNYMPFSIAYRYRLNKDSLAVDRSEVDGSITLYPLTITSTYLSLEHDPILDDKRAVTLAGTLNLTKDWSWSVNGNEDLLLHEISEIGTGITFKNECVSLTAMVNRDYTQLLDVKPSTNVMFMISLKNLE